MPFPKGHVFRPLAERFWEKVKIGAPTECWLWEGNRQNQGYGLIFKEGRQLLPHRVAWELAYGQPPPAGLELDHLCRVRLCVNPNHLEPVTHRENCRRGMAPAAIRARDTHCRNGHEFTPENTIRTRKGWRRCRACHLAWRRAAYKAGRNP
jgi:hypothetical protein